MNRRYSNSICRSPLHIESLEERCTPAVTIQLDYRFDVQGFFNVQARRDLLQFAADSLASRLDDTLAAIVPGGFNTWQARFTNPGTGASAAVDNLVVPANTIVIFVAGRTLPGFSELGVGGPGGWSASGTQDWLNTVDARGQAGALGPTSTQTDFGPWGGAISFDTSANWYFNVDASGLGPTKDDFLSVAEHEIGHVLGFGTADSWSNRVTGNSFLGPASRAQYGGDVPLDASGVNAAHWMDDTVDLGTAGMPTAGMDPALLAGSRATFTPLDFAALQDLGWQVQSTRGAAAGKLFEDANANTLFDTGEPGLGNRVIFADLDGNGLRDAGEPFTLTGGDGSYRLDLQPSGTAYRIQVQSQAGESITSPVLGSYSVTIAANATVSNRDFGMSFTDAGHVTGKLFYDSNANGAFDVGEIMLGSRMVFADLNVNGIMDAGEPGTGTANDGTYNLTLHQTAGSQRITLAAAGGDLVSFPGAASYQVQVTAGATATGKDFGAVLTSIAVPLLLPPNASFQATGDPFADYVEALYRSILHRNGSASEYTSWVNLLHANQSARTTVVLSFWNSAEHRGLQVDAFFSSILRRAADAQGRTYWVDQLQHGVLEETIAIGFLESPEFLSQGDRFFIDYLYQSVLGRPFDASGEAFWLATLSNHQMTHDQVVQGFLYSPESLRRLVDGYYSVYLNRAVDAAGETYWVNLLTHALPFASIGQQFLATDEFFARGGR